MKARPYKGVTGPVTKDEVRDIIAAFSENGCDMDSFHVPMVGFLVSYKTLNGERTENRRYPKYENLIPLIRTAAGHALTMIHYNTKEQSTLADQVERIFSPLCPDNLCRAIQLNVVWPDVREVHRIKDQLPDLSIVFQASHKAMDGRNDSEVVEEIKRYEDSIDYVLIDPSGERGLEFDIASSISLYNLLKAEIPHTRIGFAGGFTGKNVRSRINEITDITGDSDFCIDAEGGLRDKLSEKYGDDIFSKEKVREYARESENLY